MGDWFATTASSGALLIALPIAFLAGLASFFSPCMMPLLPGYVSYVSGLSAADLADAKRGRMLLGASLFVLGFSAMFVSYGLAFGAVGFRLLQYQHTLNVILGLVMIAMGVMFMGYVPFAQRQLRVRAFPGVGLGAAPLLGVLFGLGWTPCLGPTLTAVLSLSMSEASASRGSILTAMYCLGLGLPFIIAAVAYRRMLGAIKWVQRHHTTVNRVGGALMIGVGILLLTGLWQDLISQLQQYTSSYTAPI